MASLNQRGPIIQVAPTSHLARLAQGAFVSLQPMRKHKNLLSSSTSNAAHGRGILTAHSRCCTCKQLFAQLQPSQSSRRCRLTPVQADTGSAPSCYWPSWPVPLNIVLGVNETSSRRRQPQARKLRATRRTSRGRVHSRGHPLCPGTRQSLLPASRTRQCRASHRSR